MRHQSPGKGMCSVSVCMGGEKELGHFGRLVFPSTPRKILEQVTNEMLCKHREVNKMNSNQIDLSRTSHVKPI